VAGMKQVERPVRTHYSLAGALPLPPAEDQLTLRNDLSQTYVPRRVRVGNSRETYSSM
jgi:hypothetical protein